MDRIVLDRKVEIEKEIFVIGPPLEALRFQRRHVGSLVTLTDPEGNDFRGRVVSLSRVGASILIFEAFPSPTESSLEIILLQALPEKERMELIIQKTTELGVSRVISFQSSRSISLEEREAKQKKSHRWQEIAIKAADQCRRARIPSVEYFPSLEHALKICEGEGLKLLLWEKTGELLKKVLRQYKFGVRNAGCGEKKPLKEDKFGVVSSGFGEKEQKPLKKILRQHRGTIYGMVGPEGGFNEEEVGATKDKGFIPVKLGQRILRTETAAITLVGILQYELGDLSQSPRT
jgi:16S rRNA (uracil1498-N3)-methyltransferase